MSSIPSSQSTMFCLFYWNTNFNYLELISSILWSIFWYYTGCIRAEIAFPISISMIAILLFESYGLIQKYISVIRISLSIRSLQTLIALGLLIFVAITDIHSVDEEWWNFTPKTQLFLVCLLSFSLIYYICKAVSLFKVQKLMLLISQQENIINNLPTTNVQQKNQTTFSINYKYVDENMIHPLPILKSMVVKKLSIDEATCRTERQFV